MDGWDIIFDSRKRKAILEMLYDEGEIIRFTVSGLNVPFYIAKEDRSFFEFKEKKKK